MAAYILDTQTHSQYLKQSNQLSTHKTIGYTHMRTIFLATFILMPLHAHATPISDWLTHTIMKRSFQHKQAYPVTLDASCIQTCPMPAPQVPPAQRAQATITTQDAQAAYIENLEKKLNEYARRMCPEAEIPAKACEIFSREFIKLAASKHTLAPHLYIRELQSLHAYARQYLS